MFPPSQNFSQDVKALSGVMGSISIACWVVVFSPQIVENLRRSSAEGLSKTFLVIWLAGDVFNILGGVLQDVLPTMIILAVYYTIADIVLLWQCLYYSYRNRQSPSSSHSRHQHAYDPDAPVDATHLSPATPLLRKPSSSTLSSKSSASVRGFSSRIWRKTLFNLFSVLLVCIAGVTGWWIPQSSFGRDDEKITPPKGVDDIDLSFSPLGQVFGWLCAVLYLGSRVPQIALNAKRRSCEGVSILFFIFACLGNLTYVISILAYLPVTEDGSWNHTRYRKYVAVNASWLAGSVGTLLLDFIIFAQFFYFGTEEYKGGDVNDEPEAVTVSGDE